MFHVIEAEPPVSEWLPIHGIGEVTVQLVAKANAAMEALLASTGSALHGLSVTSEVTSGRAFDEIVHRAREWRADLIVVGSRGEASIEKLVLGSTAEHVMKSANGSVLVTRLRRPEAKELSDDRAVH